MVLTTERVLRVFLAACAACSVTAGSAEAAAVEGRVKHVITASLDPAAHRLAVTDTVRLPSRPPDGVVEFVLNRALRLTRSDPPAVEVSGPIDARFFGINGGGDSAQQAPARKYRVRLPAGVVAVALAYDGALDFGLSAEREQYTRGFRETLGLLRPEGVYLAGAGLWYPSFNRDLLEFSLEVAQPAGWQVVSQGNGTSRGADGRARWESAGPMDEIYLVGGPLQVFRDAAGPVQTLVYLHDRDESLAAKYLAATAQYLEMYRQLIGPYPYGKFALVENFWETGYGMPTFTLLGREVIRFPFIINSSYPHEILHNWWGNSVFVDYERGNWCEGLTAYLADHLIQEQRGSGAEYRRATLQKYRDYVKAGRDFPLTAFRSRESASTEAVGYGKALMAFHMLRLALGDEAFRKAVARFYADFKGKRASWADFERTVEAASGRGLGRFFEDWVQRAGAPVLAVEHAKAGRVADSGLHPGRVSGPAAEYLVTGVLRQVQGGQPFAIDVPVVIQTTQGVVRETVRLAGAEQAFTLATPDPPLALHVDPYFDVFRKLDPRETPPSIGQIFGEPRVLAILPASVEGGDAELAAWRALFQGWVSDSHAIEIKTDREVSELPADRAVWIAGTANKWASLFREQVTIGDGWLEIDGDRLAGADAKTIVLTRRHPGNPEKAVGWLKVAPLAAFPGLGRKLPHYGKYSYLGFEGDEPVNVLKGQWPGSDSPLTVELRLRDAANASTGGASHAPARLPPLEADRREALAALPPVFSQKTLVEHVAFLADPAREGRGPGSEGHAQAAQYIADRFKAYGLVPGGDAGGYFQAFTMQAGGNPADAGSPVREARVANLVGYIPGTKAEWKDQSVLVTAHYDHLGLGWPDVHKGDEGKVHPGADDNASGVSVLLELAHVLAGAEKPPRTIVFVAFTGEEAGLRGSSYYVEHAGAFPLGKTIGVINLDTVGRLGDQKISVLGTGTASEWQHIFRGASYVTGVDSRNVPESLQASDQVSFVKKGVPAVQIFTSAHGDYHRPTDTSDRIDGAGLVKVAAFVREGVMYLAERPDPLTNTISPAAGGTPSGAAAGATPPAASGRRVSFGTVPDFAFAGPGVRVTGTVAGSPAEKAGVLAGDVLVKIEGRPVADLKAYAEALRGLSPGQTVSAVFVRDGKEVTLRVTLAER